MTMVTSENMIYPIVDRDIEERDPMAYAVVAYATDLAQAEALVEALNRATILPIPARYRIGCLDETGLGVLLRGVADFAETSLYRR